jgi:hypothetical protein
LTPSIAVLITVAASLFAAVALPGEAVALLVATVALTTTATLTTTAPLGTPAALTTPAAPPRHISK